MDHTPKGRPGPRGVAWGRLPGLVVGAFFVIAALGKIGDSEQVRTVLAYLGVVPHRQSMAAIVAAGVLAGTELALGLWLAIGPRRAAGLAGMLLLGVFTVVLVRLAGDPSAPSCGCLPEWIASGSAGREAWGGVVRNLGLMGLCAMIASDRGAHPAPRGPVVAPSDSHGPRPAFALVELLVVIAVLAVLVALVMPSLGRTRERAREAAAMSGLRQTHASILLYAADYAGVAPFMATPERPWEPLSVNGVTPRDHEYFSQRVYYINRLYPAYSDQWQVFSHTSHTKPPNFLWARFWLTQTAMARPSYWSTDETPNDLSLYRPSRLDEMAYPAAKGLLLDVQSGAFWHTRNPSAPPGSIFVGAGDGSAAARPLTEELNNNFVYRPYAAAPYPTLSTRHGFLGRDF